MQKGVISISLVPVRLEPRSTSEMVTQLLFGETFEVIEGIETDWIKIKNEADGYIGFINHTQFVVFDNALVQPSVVTKYPYVQAKVKGQSCYLLPGSIVDLSKLPEGISRADIEKVKTTQIIDFARNFIGSPYLWGGKSFMGIDCSGFTQVVFKVCGIELPRDAWQQANLGSTRTFVNEAQPGDLAFFDNQDGKITHVGILTGKGTILHASGWVKEDKIDSYGIFNESNKKYSHKLRIIKSVLA